MSRPFKTIQDDILTRIADFDDLIGVYCIGQDRGDIDTQIASAIGAVSHGIFVIVEALGGPITTNLAKLELDIGITIEEHVTINRAQDGYKAWDQVVVALITLFGTPSGNANQPLILRPETAKALQDTGGIVKWQIMGKTRVQWAHTPEPS